MPDDESSRPFVLRWRSAVLDAELSSTQKLCLLVLAEWADPNGENCYPSITSVAQKASINEKTARRALDQCADLGFFTRVHRGTSQGWRRFAYRLTLPKGAGAASAPLEERAGTTPAPEPATCGLSFPDVRTLRPERAGTVPTDLSRDLSRDLSQESSAPLEGRQRKVRSIGLTWRQWVESKPANEKLIPAADPVFRYAAEIGLPREFLHLHWLTFSQRYSGTTKRQRDWRAHFRNSVRANWYRLWFIAPDGSFQLTTQGKQAELEHRASREANSSDDGEPDAPQEIAA